MELRNPLDNYAHFVAEQTEVRQLFQVSVGAAGEAVEGQFK